MGKCLTTYMNEEVTEVWAGKLSNGTYAVLLLNKGSFTNDVEINWEEIGFDNIYAKLRDLWAKKDLGLFKLKYKVSLKSHSSQLLKITPYKPKKLTKSNLAIILIVTFIILAIIIAAVIVVIKLKKSEDKTLDKEVNNMEENIIDKK